MLNIAVIGRTETIMGFKALGLLTYPVSNGEEALKHLKELTKESENYAIIYVEETFADSIESEMNKFKDAPSPAIILIPGRDGSTGRGLDALNSAVERAIGMNILD